MKNILKKEDKYKIRKLYKTGKYSFVELASKFNVSNTTIRYWVGVKEKEAIKQNQKRWYNKKYGQETTR